MSLQQDQGLLIMIHGNGGWMHFFKKKIDRGLSCMNSETLCVSLNRYSKYTTS